MDNNPLDSLPSELRGLEPERLAMLLAMELDARLKSMQLQDYWPYPKQAAFHRAGAQFRERCLFGANQSGKTLAGGVEVATHLLGDYPDWWKGKRFAGPNHWLAGSETGKLTRKGIQRHLFGRDVKTGLGTSLIPRDRIVSVTWSRHVADLIDTAKISNASGGISTIGLKSYDQGRAAWQADSVDGVWFDEPPPYDVYTEGLTRTNLVQGPIILTQTPMLGMDGPTSRFLLEKVQGTWYVVLALEDAEHYTEEERQAIIASYPEHERAARARGIPTLGSGRIFPISEDAIKYKLEPALKHFAQIVGIDFGWEHPTAAVWLAWDRDADIVYVRDAYRLKEQPVPIHAAAIKARGQWIPVAWPHDGYQHDKGGGEQLAQQYRDNGVGMLMEHARLPETGHDGETPVSRMSVEAGLSIMLERFQTRRLVVADHLSEWFEEFNLYHRKDGKIVKLQDDLMSATRYAIAMLRFAQAEPVKSLKRGTIGAADSWRL